MDDQFASDWFTQLLDMKQKKVEHFHRGTSPDDYLYDQAESVKQASIPRYVDVTYQGQEYKTKHATWGPLDGDKEKMTVLIQRQDQKWVKLWYFSRDVSE